MKVSTKEYEEMTKYRSPGTKLHITLPKAFLIGGLICALGEGFYKLYEAAGFPEKHTGMLTSATLILISAILTGLHLYDKIAKHGGAGTFVPITGFANSVVSPAMEFKTEGYIMGVGAKMFIIAGPVIVYGMTSSVLYGFILCLMQISF